VDFLTHQTTSGLPDDILEHARRRLSWAGGIYAVLFFLAYGLPRLLGVYEGDPVMRVLPDTVAAVAMTFGIGLAFISRASSISTPRVLDLGLAFE
jgi:hypothetical protein